VVSVQDQGHVEGFLRNDARFLTSQHVEEVPCVREVRPGLDSLFTAAKAVVVGENRRNLGGDPAPLALGRFEVFGVGVGLGFAGRQRRDAGPKRRHRVLVGFGENPKRVQCLPFDPTLVGHRLGKRVESRPIWQLVLPQQVQHFLVARVLSQVLDIVPLVDEPPRVTVDVTHF
jgi:hypothetical protein